MTQEMKACRFDLVSINRTFVDRVFALMTAVIAAMETSDVRPNTKNEYSKLRNVLDMRARESYHSEKTLMTMACSPALNLRYGQLLGIHVLANLSEVYGLCPVMKHTNAMSRNMFNRDRDWCALLLAAIIRLRVCTNGLPTYAQRIMLRGYIRGMGLEENDPICTNVDNYVRQHGSNAAVCGGFTMFPSKKDPSLYFVRLLIT